MKFDDYQTKTASTAIYPGSGTIMGLAYTGLGLGEAGEVQGKIKKVLRDNDGVITDAVADAISAELGDLLWYVAQTASELNLSLSGIAQANLNKLADRANRGVIQGSGDNR